MSTPAKTTALPPGSVTSPRRFSQRFDLSSATIYREIAAGRLPRPIRLTPGRVAWTEDQIQAWLAARKAAK